MNVVAWCLKFYIERNVIVTYMGKMSPKLLPSKVSSCDNCFASGAWPKSGIKIRVIVIINVNSIILLI